MIKVVFTYKTKSEDLDELLNKFKHSAHRSFDSEVSNTGISMYKRVENEDTYIVLDIFYNNIEEYKIRTDFERSNEKWCDIWFNKNNKHIEVSVEIFEVM